MILSGPDIFDLLLFSNAYDGVMVTGVCNNFDNLLCRWLYRFIFLIIVLLDKLQRAINHKKYEHHSNRCREYARKFQADARQCRTVLFLFAFVTNLHSILRNKWYVPVVIHATSGINTIGMMLVRVFYCILSCLEYRGYCLCCGTYFCKTK